MACIPPTLEGWVYIDPIHGPLDEPLYTWAQYTPTLRFSKKCWKKTAHSLVMLIWLCRKWKLKGPFCNLFPSRQIIRKWKASKVRTKDECFMWPELLERINGNGNAIFVIFFPLVEVMKLVKTNRNEFNDGLSCLRYILSYYFYSYLLLWKCHLSSYCDPFVLSVYV